MNAFKWTPNGESMPIFLALLDEDKHMDHGTIALFTHIDEFGNIIKRDDGANASWFLPKDDKNIEPYSIKQATLF